MDKPKGNEPSWAGVAGGTVAGDCDRGHSHAHLSAPAVPGSKAASGAWQNIVSAMPPHDVFIEAFAGSAAVSRFKRPAELTVLVERDATTAGQLRASMGYRPSTIVVHGDARSTIALGKLGGRVCLYCDPPYLMETRRSKRPIYRWEWSDADHVQFLEWIKTASCPVLVSGYWSSMYAAALADWRVMSFPVPTRRGRAIEYLWMNYPEPEARHDTAHVGKSYIDRQRIKRKAQRWVRMLAAMPPAERAAILAAVADYASSYGRNPRG